MYNLAYKYIVEQTYDTWHLKLKTIHVISLFHQGV